MNKIKLKETQSKGGKALKHEELIEEEMIDKINSQIQISTSDNLNFQREDNGNLVHISSVTNAHPKCKSEKSIISKDIPENVRKDNEDSFIQKMSVNELEFNLKSIRSACKKNVPEENTKTNKEINVHFNKRPIRQKANDSQINGSKDIISIQKSNLNKENKYKERKRCECSVKLIVTIFSIVIIVSITLVIIGVLMNR